MERWHDDDRLRRLQRRANAWRVPDAGSSHRGHYEFVISGAPCVTRRGAFTTSRITTKPPPTSPRSARKMSAKTTNLQNYRGALLDDNEFGWLRSMFYEGAPANPIRRPRMIPRSPRVTETETPATVSAARGQNESCSSNEMRTRICATAQQKNCDTPPQVSLCVPADAPLRDYAARPARWRRPYGRPISLVPSVVLEQPARPKSPLVALELEQIQSSSRANRDRTGRDSRRHREQANAPMLDGG